MAGAGRVLLTQVDEAVERLIQAVQEATDPESLRVDDWSVQDTLGHIAFWHESFARNVKAMVGVENQMCWREAILISTEWALSGLAK